MEKVVVKFIKGNGVFCAGDTTQLDKEHADKHLKEGIIEIIDIAAPPSEPGLDLSKLPPIPADKYICSICGKEFKTKLALKAHKTKAHKIG